jgi:macrodomain Ter protein organizer (MatP/YcbG family)
MEEVVIGGKKIKLFEDVEELKWYYHAKACHGDHLAECFMDQCVKQEDVNEWLKRMNEPCRVKET